MAPLLNGAAFRGAIVLRHLHWDHTHGLPFFGAGDHPDAEVDLYLPAQGADPEELLGRGMSPPHFPIRPAQLRGCWRFHALDEGTFTLGGFSVTAREIPHKGGRTFGYRVSDGATALAYLSDHHPLSAGPGADGFGEYHDAALALAADVDVLIHDAQYTAAELPIRGHFGHSTADYAVGLAQEAGAASVVLFHHDPPRTDIEMDELVASAMRRAGSLPVSAAMADMTIQLGAR
ncbi:MAG: hypothetical protein GEU74_15840 [Nitriliruptorales bacterium]|nr:hypothetical protein [Nitriliruptorales bacterium]